MQWSKLNEHIDLDLNLHVIYDVFCCTTNLINCNEWLTQNKQYTNTFINEGKRHDEIKTIKPNVFNKKKLITFSSSTKILIYYATSLYFYQPDSY